MEFTTPLSTPVSRENKRPGKISASTLARRGVRLGVAALISMLILFVLLDARITTVWSQIEVRYAYAPVLFALAAIVFLAADSLLPVPAIAVLAGAGVLLGPLWGAIVCTVGLNAGNAIAYSIGRIAARRPGEGTGPSSGVSPLVVASTRCVPLLAELICLRAGYRHMRLDAFAAAATLGNAVFAIVTCCAAVRVLNPG